MKLAIAQIAIGALVTASAILIFAWGFSIPYSELLTDGTILKQVFGTPTPQAVAARSLTMATTLLGLAVAGCGIAQLVKAKRFKGTKND